MSLRLSEKVRVVGEHLHLTLTLSDAEVLMFTASDSDPLTRMIAKSIVQMKAANRGSFA